MSTIPSGPPSDPVPFQRRTIDVSKLPDEVFGERSPVWWGNTLMLFIETSTVAILIVSYFYLRMNFQQWPPPKVDVIPPIEHPVPDLGVSTLNAVLMLLSVPVMVWTHRAALRMDKRKVLTGVAVMFAASVLVSVLRCAEFRATKFWWNDNAYASIVWTIIGMHLLYSLSGALEFLVMGLWILSHELDEAHALDVTLAGIYWYWVVGTGVLVYGVVYWGGRLL
jgi:cytochrome c oxidase subunit III